MCMAYISSKRRRQPTPSKEAAGSSNPKRIKHRWKWPNFKKINKKNKQRGTQLSLFDCFSIVPNDDGTGNQSGPAQETSGDPLLPKSTKHVRFVFQNVNGLNLCKGLHVLPETATMEPFRLTSQPSPRPTSTGTRLPKSKSNNKVHAHLGTFRMICASNISMVPMDGYQPDSSMLALIGPQCGRIADLGSNLWG